MKVNPLAGKPAQPTMLVNVPRLITAYYSNMPDTSVPGQGVAFGTSGHRGSAFENSFNEWHVLAISQAVCDYRKLQGIGGPLFLGIDTHALSVPAFTSALEVLAANGVEVMIANKDEYTPTPVISHAILTYNRGRDNGLADGVVITPSHNPPEAAASNTTRPTAGQLIRTSQDGSKRTPMRFWRAAFQGVKKNTFREGATRCHNAPTRLSQCLCRRSRQRARHGGDSRRGHPHGRGSAGWRRRSLLGPDSRALWVESHAGERCRRSDLSFHDGRLGRSNSHGPSSSYAMQSLIGLKDRFDIAFAPATPTTTGTASSPAARACCRPIITFRSPFSTSSSIARSGTRMRRWARRSSAAR